MLKHPLVLLLACALCVLTACSRDEAREQGADDESAGANAEGDDSALRHVRAGTRALTQPGGAVDYIAAEMEGVIMARTKSQALMHYDGYRVTLTTPGDRVTQIKFDLIEAKPTIKSRFAPPPPPLVAGGPAPDIELLHSSEVRGFYQPCG